MSNIITFAATGVFEACNAAEKWLRERGFSVGQAQGPSPRAVWLGDCDISKWRNLSAADKRQMHATVTGDPRHGPVHVRLTPSATSEAIAAFNMESVKA